MKEPLCVYSFHILSSDLVLTLLHQPYPVRNFHPGHPWNTTDEPNTVESGMVRSLSHVPLRMLRGTHRRVMSSCWVVDIDNLRKALPEGKVNVRWKLLVLGVEHSLVLAHLLTQPWQEGSVTSWN